MTQVDTRPYRIGWWTHHWWPHWWRISVIVTGWNPKNRRQERRTRLARIREVCRDLRLIRRPHRPWQAEASELPLRFARRAFTADGARRKIEDDVQHYAFTGQPSPWQTRRAARADARRPGASARNERTGGTCEH